MNPVPDILQPRPCNLRYGVCFLILLLSSFLLYFLCLRLISQVYLFKAENCIRKEYYGLALTYLEKAAGYPFADSEIYRNRGESLYSLAWIAWDENSRFTYLKDSDAAFRKAAELNPLDFRIFSALAKTQWSLLRLYRNQYPHHSDPPWKPLPFFQESVRLRPNGIQNNFALLRFLAWEGKRDEMGGLVRKLVQNYPPVFHYLKKEAFWSENLMPFCREGLEIAIEKGTMQRESHLILSGIMVGDKNWPDAIFHYQKALEYKAFQNSSPEYYRLGHLFFQNGEKEKAQTEYLRGLDISPNREKDLEGLYAFYRNQKDSEGFYAFFPEVRKKYSLSFRSDILLACVLTDLEQYESAKEILRQVNERRPEAEAFYQLARIAEKEQDWDAMELAIQKATVYDPGNRHYHAVFSNVLRRLKKFERAEKEAGLARK